MPINTYLYDARTQEVVGIEELGLRFATVGAFAVPPVGAFAIKHGSAGTLDGNIGTGNRDERAVPFLVAESGGTFEDDLYMQSVWRLRQSKRADVMYRGAAREAGQVERSAGWDGNAGQNDG
jgi:hypothetical protein